MLAIRNTSLPLEQVWHGYNQAPEKYSAVNIKIGISQNTKCAIWNGFPKSSHICDRLCKNQPCSHLVVIRETLV